MHNCGVKRNELKEIFRDPRSNNPLLPFFPVVFAYKYWFLEERVHQFKEIKAVGTLLAIPWEKFAFKKFE